jgi:flagellar FliL protein
MAATNKNMTKTTKIILILAGMALLGGAAAAGFMWRPSHAPASTVAAPKELPPKKPSKYVTLDKVIVMLRRAPNEAEAHYLAAELVLATDEEKEKTTKEHLPLLRSLTVRALSGYTMQSASAMTVEQYADLLNKNFDASYSKDRLEKPFHEVMIGKLIIE